MDDELIDHVSIGVVALAGWQGCKVRYAGTTLYAPVTVRVVPSLWLYANAGRAWSNGLPSNSRAGLAAEWVPLRDGILIGEVFRQLGGNFAVFGTRWQNGANLGIDLSFARGLGATPGAW